MLKALIQKRTKLALIVGEATCISMLAEKLMVFEEVNIESVGSSTLNVIRDSKLYSISCVSLFPVQDLSTAYYIPLKGFRCYGDAEELSMKEMMDLIENYVD